MEINLFEQIFLFISHAIRFTLACHPFGVVLRLNTSFEVAACYGTLVGICGECRIAFLFVVILVN
jgi:hypothetical protein